MPLFNSVSRLILIVLFQFFFEMIVAQGLDTSVQQDHANTSLNNPQTNLESYLINSIEQDEIELNNHIQILKENNLNPASNDINSIIQNPGFKPFNPDSIDCATCLYWGNISIKNGTTTKINDWILYLGILSKVDVYLLNKKDSLLSIQKTGRSVGANQKLFTDGNRKERVRLDFLENQELHIYFRFVNTNGYLPKLNVKLCQGDFFKSKAYNFQKIADGLFIGFLVSLILFNLIFFITTRDIAFFYQFVFVISVLVFMMDVMDLICDFPILRDHPFWFEPINFSAIIFLNISYLYFVSKFIQIEKVFPRWISIIKKLVQLNLVLGSVIIIYYGITLNERVADTAIALVCTVQYITLLILLFQLYKIRNLKSYFILIATLFLIGGVIINGIAIVFEWGVQINFSKFAVLGNLSFFFFGLAYRMKLLKEEEHEAIRLKENQELKNKLYANITHEFRTPLTVIQGMTQQIESSLKIPETSKTHQAIQLIKSNGQRLLKLVNTILDLAKMESGKMELHLIHSDIINYLRYLVQLFETFAENKKIALRFLTELDSLEMDFDKEKLQQIVSNLISNAIKFTPPGGKIYFSVRKLEIKQQFYLQFEVKDTGEGISKTELANIFNRFFQAESSTHKSQGSGLGLALVHELVRLMDGQVEVDSELEKGTTFRVTIPIRSKQIGSGNMVNQQATLDDHAKIFSEIALDANQIVENQKGDIKHLNHTQTIDSLEHEKPLLLIIDDSRDVIYYLQTLLENQYTIETAYSGHDGISLALEIIPDIIISDLVMPDKDGYEICETLKQDVRTSHIPIILLTAKSAVSARITGLQKGADAYLSKPFDELELKVQLENLLHIRKMLQEHYKVSESKVESQAEPKPIEDAFLIKLKALIHAKLDDEDFGILQLCRSMQMSRTQLHRKITALTGKSTSIYLRYLRLQQAKILLKKEELNISEVAFAVGFSDPNYFTRTFTEEFGITPTGFRTGI
jgi:signal transduction histidine kinase/CheY-like chemotaxis protein/AraC-like DNA-binding protein